MENAIRLSKAERKLQGVTILHNMTVKEREQRRMVVTETKQKQNEDKRGEYIYRI